MNKLHIPYPLFANLTFLNSLQWNLEFMNSIFLFEMGCRTLVCREANILLRRNCIYELNGTKKIFGNKHWRERLKHGQKWNVDGNFMLLDGGLSYVHWSEERTVIDLYVQINFYLRYLRLPICNKIDILMFSSLKAFEIVNQLILFHVSYFGYVPIIVFLHDQNKYHIYLY